MKLFGNTKSKREFPQEPVNTAAAVGDEFDLSRFGIVEEQEETKGIVISTTQFPEAYEEEYPDAASSDEKQYQLNFENNSYNYDEKADSRQPEEKKALSGNVKGAILLVASVLIFLFVIFVVYIKLTSGGGIQ